MKVRLVVASLLAAGLAFSVSGAQAGPPVMDGVKVKVLSKTDMVAPQQQVSGFSSLTCESPKCMVLPFVYRPAKGVKGDLMFTVQWTNPLSDMDLYVVEVDTKKKTETQIAVCGGFPGAKERVFIPAKDLRSGRTYKLVVNYYLSLNETVTGKVEIAVPNTIPTSVPAAVDAEHGTNCTL